MGFSIDREFVLHIPADRLDAVLDVVGVDRHLDRDKRIADLVDAFIAAYNEGGELMLGVELANDGSGVVGYTLIGSTWGKTHAATDDTTTGELAHLGVTGVIDCHGEDDTLWRERLHGGEVSLHNGVVAYPSDHYQE